MGHNKCNILKEILNKEWQQFTLQYELQYGVKHIQAGTSNGPTMQIYTTRLGWNSSHSSYTIVVRSTMNG